MGAKMQIMESDAKQQMELKRREAFFNMLFHQRASLPYLLLSIRRQYLIEDSLRQVTFFLFFLIFFFEIDNIIYAYLFI